MKKIIFCLLFLPGILSAQINVSDTLKLKADVSLTGFLQGGNVEAVVFRAKQDFSYKALKKWVFRTTNSYVYQEFGQVKADEDFLSLNFIYFNPEKKLYPQLIGIGATNFRRQLDFRSLFGFGLTYQILNEKKSWLKVSLSSEYEQMNFRTSDFNIAEYDGDVNINTLRGTIWLSGRYHLIDEKMILSLISFYQPSLEKNNNYRWQTDFAMEIPLRKYFSFKINYLDTYESIVVQGIREGDRTLTFGFSLRSY